MKKNQKPETNILQDPQVKNFLAILAGAVHGEPITERLIQPVDWDEIFRLASMHNLFPLVFEKASEVPGFDETPGYERYMVKASKQVADQVGHTQAFLKVYQTLLDAGLSPLVMKGIICRELYGELGEHRPSGDEDMLIRVEDYPKVEKVMIEQGFVPGNKITSAEQLMSIQETGFYDRKSGLHIETHVKLFGGESSLREHMNTLFDGAFDDTEIVHIYGVDFATMNHSNHFLFLVLHAFKHLTGGGFGIRHVIDVLLFSKVYHDFIDWDYIETSLAQCGANSFLSDLMHIGNQYLGFRQPVTAEPKCPEALLSDIMSHGVFGHEIVGISGFNQAAIEQTQGHGKVWALLHTAFPGKEMYIHSNPELIDQPWLLPKFWARRWMKLIRKSREAGKNLAIESMRASRKRMTVLEQYLGSSDAAWFAKNPKGK